MVEMAERNEQTSVLGLTDDEVSDSRVKNGSNKLTELKSEGFWEKLIGNFGDPMIKILCVALAINIVFAFLGQAEWYEPIGIALAVVLATFVSTLSEYRNENAFQKLQEEASRIYCNVYRNGNITNVPIDDIVVGDLVVIQSGDKIPADGYVFKGELKVDQSALNGEAAEAVKYAKPDGYVEDKEMDFLDPTKVFRGSVVCSGDAIIFVETVGDKTVYGNLAAELQDDEERDSPLKIKLQKLADGISKFGYIGGILIAVALLFQRIIVANQFDMTLIGEYFSNWMNVVSDVIDAVILAVIIIVMAVPEGLPLMIAIVSALNMSKMLKDNVLVRKIAGIETAGSLNILFSDKTGTITKGQLETVLFVDGKCSEYQKYESIPDKLREMLSLSIHQNTMAFISGEESERRIAGGNSTERAILQFAMSEVPSGYINKEATIPFNSANKYSAATISGDRNITLIKGAPEKLIGRCSRCYTDDGDVIEFDPQKSGIEQKIDSLAERSIRVLAFAVSEQRIIDDELSDGNDWIFVGIVGIRDDVRPESKAAINEVKQAGVQVVMITGDRKETAVAIAKESDIITSDDDVVLTSGELAEMDDDTLTKLLPKIKVVARALPSDKSRLVRVAQNSDLVVGMTGDGVNDSPALKKADVGFAMGGGTEVAKEAGDIVILDDNFSSIEKAILYGRTIFNSIRKFIIFQLTINVAAVLISFVMPLLGKANPLSITQILWVNLVMDTLAALAFGGEPALKRFMKEKPKKRDENIVSKYMWSEIITGSIWTFALSMLFLESSFVSGFFRADESSKYLLTGYFCFFIFTSVFNAFNARTDQFNLFDNITSNTGFLKVLGLIVVVQIVMTYVGGAVLSCYGLNITEWIVTLIMALTIIPVDLIRKAIVRKAIKY